MWSNSILNGKNQSKFNTSFFFAKIGIRWRQIVLLTYTIYSSHLALVDIGHVDARSIASHKTTVDSIEWRQHILPAVNVMLQLSTYISCQHTMSAPNIYKLRTHNVDIDIYKLSMHTISVSIGTHTDTKCVLST